MEDKPIVYNLHVYFLYLMFI
uniref:Uncharacterized protein n=1 Tax=Rhizophora mucronata TaxID=61149 RepID=A0A2P2P691_RHIMU